MNKHFFWIITVAVTVCAFSYNVIAQPPGGPGRGPGGGMGMGGPGGPGMGPGGGMGGGMGMGMMGGPAAMFQNPEFAKELGLTPAQTESLRTAITETGNAIRERMQTMFTPGGPPPNPAEMRQQMDKFIDDAQAKVNQVLRPEQQTKLREVTFQLSGGMNSPMMGVRTLETLNLTETQKEQIRKITEERDTARFATMQGVDFRNMTPEQRDKMFADGQARDKQFTDRITALLTSEQKAKMEKLTNEAPALRQKLGMPEPGQFGQQRGQQGGPRGPQGPNANSWRPGREMPGTPPPNRPGSFPRLNDNNNDD